MIPDIGIITTAIKGVLDADAGLVAAGLTVYADEAPERTDPPYLVVYDVGNTLEERTSNCELTTNRVQFSVWANRRPTATAYIKAVRDALKGKQLNLGYHRFLQLRYVQARVLREDRGVWQGILEYDLDWTNARDQRDG